MELTQEIAEIFTLRLQEAREKYGELPFEQIPQDVKDILIAGQMLDQSQTEIDRLCGVLLEANRKNTTGFSVVAGDYELGELVIKSSCDDLSFHEAIEELKECQGYEYSVMKFNGMKLSF